MERSWLADSFGGSRKPSAVREERGRPGATQHRAGPSNHLAKTRAWSTRRAERHGGQKLDDKGSYMRWDAFRRIFWELVEVLGGWCW